MGLNRFDEAKECFESLRRFGQVSIADDYLKKVFDATKKITIKNQPLQNSCENHNQIERSSIENPIKNESFQKIELNKDQTARNSNDDKNKIFLFVLPLIFLILSILIYHINYVWTLLNRR